MASESVTAPSVTIPSLKAAWLYCENKVAPSGSDWYYALVKAPQPCRQAALALLTLAADWQAITHDCQDASLAALKFAWWHEELTQAFAGTASHPALQLLQPIIGEFALPLSLLQAMLQQCQLPPYLFEHFTDCQHAAFSQVDAIFIIGLYVLARRDSTQATALHHLNFSLQLWDAINHLPRLLKQQRLPFAQTDLQALGLTPDAPDTWLNQPAFTTLLADYHAHANHYYQQALAALTPAQKSQQKPLLRYAKIQHALAAKTKRAGYPVFRYQTTLTPLHKLALTWFL